MIDTEVAGTLADLRQTVRAHMLPESSNLPITRETVLSWFNVADPRSLFPCPPEFEDTEDPISRRSTNDLALAVKSSQFVCLDGRGGCGKTTTVRNLSSNLPAGSQVIVFDCYGGGSHLDSSLSRHRPTDAFVQIANEIGIRLGIPYLIPHQDNPNIASSLRKRIELASRVLTERSRHALLVVVVDAADNAVFAANQVSPPDRCFVRDFASMERLPDNVRLVLTSRTSRLGSLELPPHFSFAHCGPFDVDETKRFITRVWPDARQEDIEQFHLLSNAIPRVQASIIRHADTLEEALQALRPSGQTLNGLFDSIISDSARKLTGSESLDRFCCAVSVLPTPAPITFVAELSQESEAFVQEVCDDLAPNLRSSDRGVEFANEDFEAYIRDRGRGLESDVRQQAADILFRESSRSSYAAIHLSDALSASGRSNELFALLNEENSTQVITDRVIRRRTELRRLKAAIAFADASGDPIEACKVVLIGAEAAQSSHKVEELLANNIDLSAWFAEQTIRQEVLRDPDSRSLHGSLLMYLASVSAQSDDTLPVAREYGRLALEWVHERSRREDHEAGSWRLEDRDIVALVYAVYRRSGWNVAERFCESWQPESLPLKLLAGLIEQIQLREGREVLEKLRKNVSQDYRWLSTVSLQRASIAVPKAQLSRELDRLLNYQFPDIWSDAEYFTGDGVGISIVYDLLFFAEICCFRKLPKTKIRRLVDLAWPKQMRSWKRSTVNDARNVDLTLRSESLLSLLQGTTFDLTKAFEIDNNRDSDDRSFSKDTNDFLSKIEPCKVFWSSSASTLDSSNCDDVMGELRKAVSALTRDSWNRQRTYGLSHLEEAVSKRIVDLRGIHGFSAAATIGLLGTLFENTDPYGQRINASLRVLLYDPTSFDAVAATLEQNIKNASQFGGPASERADVLIRASRLMLESSPEDSKAHFQGAISAIEGLDTEAIDQLQFMLAVSRRFPHDTPSTRRSCVNLSTIVEHVARALEEREGVPKREALGAMSTLSTPVALCAVSRWTDVGIFHTEDALKAVLDAALQAGTIDAAFGCALMTILDENGLSLESTVLEAVKYLSPSDQKRQINEIANRASRLREPDSIIRTYENIRAYGGNISETDEGSGQLHSLVSFLRNHATELKRPSESEARDSRLGGAGRRTRKRAAVVDSADADSISSEIERRKAAGEYIDREFFGWLRARTAPTGRVSHLRALFQLAQSSDWPFRYIEAILSCFESWSNAAVDSWFQDNTKELILTLGPNLLGFTWYERDSLTTLLNASRLNAAQKVSLIIETIEHHSEHMGSLSLFKFAAHLLLEISEGEAQELFDWYLARRLDALQSSEPPSPVVEIEYEAVPATVSESVAGMLYRLLGDVDVRVRWKAAHCLRSLVRCGATPALSEVLSCRHADFDYSFSAPEVPFHYLTARLWLAICLARIAKEYPDLVADQSQEVLAVATDGPAHLLIELHIKRALHTAMHATDVASITETDVQRLADSRAGKRVLKDGYSRSSFGHNTSQEGVRYHFDALDTLPYWYSSALGVFAEVSPEEFLTAADHLICDKWGVSEDAYKWDTEPRKDRYREYEFGLWSSGHGSYPTLERFSTYVQWHAMFVVVSEFLESRQIASLIGEETTELDDFIRRWDNTDDSYWLTDVRTPKPQGVKYWRPLKFGNDDWLDRPKNQEFFEELRDTKGRVILSSEREVVNYRYGTREAVDRVNVISALVPARTASALLRALQLTRNAHDYYFPHEPHEGFGREPAEYSGRI